MQQMIVHRMTTVSDTNFNTTDSEEEISISLPASATVDYHPLETFHAKSDRSLPHLPLMDVFMVIHSVVKITAIIWTEDRKIKLPISFSLANYHSRGMSMDTPI